MHATSVKARPVRNLSSFNKRTHFSVEVQLGHVQATLRTLLPVGVESELPVPVDREDVTDMGVDTLTDWAAGAGLLTICHLVGSFGSCWI